MSKSVIKLYELKRKFNFPESNKKKKRSKYKHIMHKRLRRQLKKQQVIEQKSFIMEE